MTTGKKIIQATTIVTVISVAVKGVGFVEKLLLAYFFGTGIQVDAYLVAYTIPFSAFIVLRDVIAPAFLPTFLQTRRASEQDGWRLFSITGTVLLILLGIAAAAGMILAKPLISLTAPGFAGAQQGLAIELTRMIMPALLLLGLSTLTTAALHAQKRFTLPALGLASFRAGPLLFLLALGSVPAMAVGVVAGSVGKLLVEILGLRRYLHAIRPSLRLTFQPVWTVGRLAAPLLVALSLSLFVGPLVDNAFASRAGVGGVSALAFARKIVETLTTILPYTLGLVLLPFSAEMAAGKDHRALARTLSQAVRALTFLFLPVTAGLVLLREPFVRLLFERGAFTASSTQLTADPLLFYALGLLPFALEVVVIQFFFARRDTLTPVITDVVAFVLNVALIPPLQAVFGLGGIALATTTAKTLKVLALLILFGRQVPAFRLGSLGPFAGKMALACLATVAAMFPLLPLSSRLGPDSSLVAQAAYLVAAGLVGGVAFLLMAYLLRVNELRRLPQQGWDWFQGWRRTRRS
ncbi:MAG: murein biosynthesis integral membrane protein MurJ [Anaerolineae bacterium]|jgi:murein biosynthesis integral membrane protein MurJ